MYVTACQKRQGLAALSGAGSSSVAFCTHLVAATASYGGPRHVYAKWEQGGESCDVLSKLRLHLWN